MLSVIEKIEKIQIYIAFCSFSGDMVFMTAKMNLRPYVIFIKPRTFDTADIKCFTVLLLVFVQFCIILSYYYDANLVSRVPPTDKRKVSKFLWNFL